MLLTMAVAVKNQVIIRAHFSVTGKKKELWSFFISCSTKKKMLKNCKC